MTTDKPGPTYWDYLGLDRLLSLQRGLAPDGESPSSDELHFIIVHQVFELWFSLILSELRLARDHFRADVVPDDKVPFVVHHLRRVATIFEHTMSQWAVMETLTPQDFLEFRDRLIPASGFQSFQLRELEILLGLDRSRRTESPHGDPIDVILELADDSPGGKMAKERIERALAEPSLRDVLHDWLYRTPVQGSTPAASDDRKVVERFIADYLNAMRANQMKQIDIFTRQGGMPRTVVEERLTASYDGAAAFLRAEDAGADASDDDRWRISRVRAAVLFIESYRDLPLLSWPRLLLDTIVNLEELLILFRTRHARMVERLIGRRMGTGGSAGVDYLDDTLRDRIFTDLWAVRTLLMPRDALPAVREPDRYGFA